MHPVQFNPILPSEIEHEKTYLAKIEPRFSNGETFWEVVKGWKMNNGEIKFIGARHYSEGEIIHLFDIIEIDSLPWG